MRPAKVIAIYPYIGANPYQLLLARAFERRGYEVRKLQSIDDRFPLRMISRCRDVDVLHLHWIEGLYEARTGFMLAVRTTVFLFILAALRFRGIRILYTLHNLVPHDATRPRFHLFVRKLLVRIAHRTIVHSHPALEAAVRQLGGAHKFVVVPHGHYRGIYPNHISRVQARAALGIEKEQKTALFFGSLHEKYKSLADLLATAEELARRNILLLIAGEAHKLAEPDQLRLREAAAEGKISLREGYIPDSEVQVFMNAADCLVVPYSESFTSGVAVVGLSFRLPVVGTEAVAFRQLVDLHLCLPCDPKVPRSVAAAIEEICAWQRAEFESRCDDFLAGCGWDEIVGKQLALCGLPADDGGLPSPRDAVSLERESRKLVGSKSS